MLEQEPAIPAVELAQRMFGAGEVVVVGVEQRSVPLDKILEASETEFRRKKKKSIQRDGMGTTKKKKKKRRDTVGRRWIRWRQTRSGVDCRFWRRRRR